MRSTPANALITGLSIAIFCACSGSGSETVVTGAGGDADGGHHNNTYGGAGGVAGDGGTSGAGSTSTGGHTTAGNGGGGAGGSENGGSENKGGTGGEQGTVDHGGSGGGGSDVGGTGGGSDVGGTGSGSDVGGSDVGGTGGGSSGSGEGLFGDPCSNGSDCVSGECVEGPAGSLVCSQKCTTTCPDAWRCAELPGSTDNGRYCVPRFSRLCRPCDETSACRLSNVPSESGRCISRGPEGSFCGASCTTESPCPVGYFCETLDFGGTLVKQCVPEGGAICGCKESWAGKGYSTTCYNENGYGRCLGSRDCNLGALSACNAKTASPEECDGIDNNCNGTVDEGSLCDDGVTCTTDSCGGSTGCKNTLQANACLINYTCYGTGQSNGTNSCQKCDPATNPTAWTTTTGSCSIDGACVSAGYQHPILTCQVCDPSKSTTTWSLASGQCLISGACYANGTANPSNACQVCDTSKSTTAWSSTPGKCQIGSACYANGAVNPSNACQVCDTAKTTSAWSLASGKCLISGTCYNENNTLSSNICQICRPSITQTDWSPNTGASCNDGNACTGSDTCTSAGVCSGTIIMGSHEPNNTSATAYNIGSMTDNDSDKKTIASKLAPQSDVDWFYTNVSDTTGHTINPEFAVKSGSAVVRACLYFLRNSGSFTVTCNDGSTTDNSTLSGYKGCCKQAVSPSFTAKYTGGLLSDDSFNARIRIDNLQTLQCLDYSFDILF